MRRLRAFWIALAVAWGSSPACSIFPDQAVLPAHDDPGGSAGILLAGGSAGGDAQELAGEAGSSASFAGQTGGASGSSASGGAAAGGASGGAAQAGELGAGGSTACKPMHTLLTPSADAWIDAAEPQVNHGPDNQLFVLGGANEQRAVFTFTVPKSKAGDELVGATLVLTLGQPPNLGGASRVLSAYTLLVGFNENRVTWSNYSNGNGKRWTTAGGDFGASFGTGTLQADTTALRLDVSALVAPVYSEQKTELDLLVRDAEPAPSAPVNFAFVSKEGSTGASPVLDIEYCRP